MNNSTDAIISVALERQAEKVHRVQAANQLLPNGFGQGLAGRPTLALAAIVVIVASVLVIAIR